MKLNLHQTKALSLVGRYYLGVIREPQTLTKKKPSLLCSFHMPGPSEAPHAHVTQETQVA